jgi:hypothetical protein
MTAAINSLFSSTEIFFPIWKVLHFNYSNLESKDYLYMSEPIVETPLMKQ